MVWQVPMANQRTGTHTSGHRPWLSYHTTLNCRVYHLTLAPVRCYIAATTRHFGEQGAPYLGPIQRPSTAAFDAASASRGALTKAPSNDHPPRRATG